jgi:hypothetical protein
MKTTALLFILLFSTSQTAHAADTVVDKFAWLEAMKTRLPNAFCGESQYFRKCFNVTEDQCIEVSLRATAICMQSIADQMPAELHQPVDGTNWGSKLGKCAGEGYEASLAKSKIDSADCKDMSHWR